MEIEEKYSKSIMGRDYGQVESFDIIKVIVEWYCSNRGLISTRLDVLIISRNGPMNRPLRSL